MVRYPSILHDPTCFHLQTLKKISKTATVAVLSWSKWWPMKPMERPKTKRPLRHPKLIKSSAFAGNDKRRKSVSSILHCVTMYHQLANRMKKTTKVITWRHYAWVSLTPCLFSWESSTGSKHVRKASLVQLIWHDSLFVSATASTQRKKLSTEKYQHASDSHQSELRTAMHPSTLRMRLARFLSAQIYIQPLKRFHSTGWDKTSSQAGTS